MSLKVNIEKDKNIWLVFIIAFSVYLTQIFLNDGLKIPFGIAIYFVFIKMFYTDLKIKCIVFKSIFILFIMLCIETVFYFGYFSFGIDLNKNTYVTIFASIPARILEGFILYIRYKKYRGELEWMKKKKVEKTCL
jgi:hypothetical protein